MLPSLTGAPSVDRLFPSRRFPSVAGTAEAQSRCGDLNVDFTTPADLTRAALYLYNVRSADTAWFGNIRVEQLGRLSRDEADGLLRAAGAAEGDAAEVQGLIAAGGKDQAKMHDRCLFR